MKYYKHSQLVKTYNVSDRTVRNWVEASLEGKIDLKLETNKGRYYVANTVANEAVLSTLAEHGRKYRNSRAHKTVKPSADFYTLFSNAQLTDLANVLDKNREISWSYSYFGEAANDWNEYLMDLHATGKGNIVTDTIESIKQGYSYIERQIEDYERVNVVAVCPANAVTLHDLLSRLKASGKLNRFIAVDISEEMLDATERNSERWFGEGFKVERQLVDVRYRLPENILTDEAAVDAGSVINLFTLVGGPLVNFENPEHVLHNINASMAKQDLLLTTVKRDSSSGLNSFEVKVRSGSSLLGSRRKRLLDLMNIDETMYDVEQYHDKVTNESYITIKLKLELTLQFMVAGYQKTIDFDRGESIVMWRAHKLADGDLLRTLESTGFEQLLMAQSDDREVLFTVSTPEAGAKRRFF